MYRFPFGYFSFDWCVATMCVFVLRSIKIKSPFECAMLDGFLFISYFQRFESVSKWSQANNDRRAEEKIPSSQMYRPNQTIRLGWREKKLNLVVVVVFMSFLFFYFASFSGRMALDDKSIQMWRFCQLIKRCVRVCVCRADVNVTKTRKCVHNPIGKKSETKWRRMLVVSGRESQPTKMKYHSMKANLFWAL